MAENEEGEETPVEPAPTSENTDVGVVPPEEEVPPVEGEVPPPPPPLPDPDPGPPDENYPPPEGPA